ncbi:hypothetical protein ABT039_33445 [Streptomyces lasiicapitis]|uniref:hypothetical protein n=1 Tax=Streptomyces lasiicapitis TaxID=1923961 RepID=UPI001E4F69D1|nr:hypothetical protein [Streptomyces lasiicapitis]
MAALTTAAALSLSACGGGDGDSKGDEKIEGAGSTASEKASPSASADERSDRPKVDMPKGVSNVFEGGATGDAKKDAVLADNARNLDAIDVAITVGGKSSQKALKFYNKGKALIATASYIQGYYDDGKSYVGATRYYDRQVTFHGVSEATVTYCADATKTYPKDRKTGKVDRSIPESANDYTFFNERLKKNAKGVWQSVDVLSETGAKKCM